MSVISITLIASDPGLTPGIPETLTVETDIPATVFYTLDGSSPDANSSVYVAPILLPSSLHQITIKLFATNGSDTSAIISQTYTADLSAVQTRSGDRMAQSTISNLGNAANNNSKFPFGDNSPQTDFQYLQIGSPDNTIYDQSKSASPNAFDADGNPAGFSNQPLSDFGIPQSTTDFEGRTGKGIGTKVPVEIIGKQGPTEYTQEISSKADKLFNPKAMVIYLDSTTDDPSNPHIVMRPHFSLQNSEVYADGGLNFSAIGLDNAGITGSFVRRTYNPNDHTLTYYYRCSSTNRWIISNTPFASSNSNVGVLDSVVFPREGAGARVFQWALFKNQRLP